MPVLSIKGLTTKQADDSWIGLNCSANPLQRQRVTLTPIELRQVKRHIRHIVQTIKACCGAVAQR
jgi:hypothetical protein